MNNEFFQPIALKKQKTIKKSNNKFGKTIQIDVDITSKKEDLMKSLRTPILSKNDFNFKEVVKAKCTQKCD
jgi:hypothetical protein